MTFWNTFKVKAYRCVGHWCGKQMFPSQQVKSGFNKQLFLPAGCSHVPLLRHQQFSGWELGPPSGSCGAVVWSGNTSWSWVSFRKQELEFSLYYKPEWEIQNPPWGEWAISHWHPTEELFLSIPNSARTKNPTLCSVTQTRAKLGVWGWRTKAYDNFRTQPLF